MSGPAQPARHALDFACGAMGGTILSGVGGGTFAGAAADSRAVTPGRLFFALPGAQLDGFDFCGQAAAGGAAAVVVDRARGVPPGCAGVAVIGVADPRRALGALARAVRARFRGQVVGITGSNGKTTTKELTAAVLATAGPVLKTQGNLNTDVGMPLTILEATGEERFWVLEMAMRARGEIAYLVEIAAPQLAVITNVAAAHLGQLGSLAEVARAKGEIFQGLGADGIAVLPTDDSLLEAEAAHLPETRKRRFGTVAGKPTGTLADPGVVRILDFSPSGVSGSVVRFSVGQEPLVVRLPLPGEHNARNAAAALAVALSLGIPRGPAGGALTTVELPPHRSRLLTLGGRTVLDDCYNANPASMNAALATLATSAGRSTRAFAVLGDMLELGPDAESLHVGLGREVANRGISGVVAMGLLGARIAEGALGAGMAAQQVVTTKDPDEAADVVAAWSAPGDWVLIKASRGARLERVIEALQHKSEAGTLTTARPMVVQPAEPLTKKAPVKKKVSAPRKKAVAARTAPPKKTAKKSPTPARRR